MKSNQQKKEMRTLLKCQSAVMFVIACIASMFFGCAEEELNNLPVKPTVRDSISVLINDYWDSNRLLTATPSVKDTLIKSDASFELQSLITNDIKNFYMEYHPSAYIHIRLIEKRIDVKDVKDIPATIVEEKIVKRTPYSNGYRYGEDVVMECSFSDQQKAVISYGYQYTAVVLNGDTIAAPYLKINAVHFKKFLTEHFGDKTATDDPYKATPVFEASYTYKGTTVTPSPGTLQLKPWYQKVVTTEPTVIKDVRYAGKYVGCPYNAYELTETLITNKGDIVNNYRVELDFKINTPQTREQPSLDSLFNKKSVGSMNESIFSENKDASGFTVCTKTGKYTSTNTGQKGKTAVESSVSFTYQYPTKFESEYGRHTIAPINIKFTEIGFNVKKVSENTDYKLFKTVNTISGEIAGCMLDDIDEIVNLKVEKPKAPTVTKRDSTYTLKGDGDEYIVEKIITWSDGSTTTSTYNYTGTHSATALSFGEVITSSLNWQNGNLQKVSQATETETKNISATTKFSAVYTTSTWQASATNNTEKGTFAFKEKSPTVTFTDGNISKTFPARKYTMTGLGAKVDNTFTTTVRNNITYKGYAYKYTTQATWNNKTETLVSEGLLLMPADEKGQPKYTTNQTWNGNTVTTKVVKTTPHTYADDEVETFTENFTVSLGNLTNDKLYADNLSFATTESHTGDRSTSENGHWKTNAYTTTYTYTTTNNVVKREQKIDVKDAEITFTDGSYSHTFDIRFNVSKSEQMQTSKTYKEGNYNVTPHLLTVSATTKDGKTLKTSGTTNIYVKKEAEVSNHTTKTIVYNDGTVDFVLTKNMDDGTTKTLKASDAFGSRFAFAFTNATAQTKVVTKATHTASGNTGTPTTTKENKSGWSITKNVYPYTHTLDNGVNADKVTSSYSYTNYAAVYSDADLGNINFATPTVNMTHKSLNITENGNEGNYAKYAAAVVVTGSATGTEGSYNKDLNVTHTLKILNDEPETPHLGKPKAFYPTATYDPTSNVTRRAFVFQWEDGVTYAVCNYEKMLPEANDFMFLTTTYKEYNSVGYDKNNSNHWQPAKGVDGNDALRWYYANGSLMSAIDKSLTCAVIGWKNIVNGQYALLIPNYTYTISGYNITITAPNGQTVTFNSHHN